MNAREVISRMKPAKRDTAKRLMYSFRVTEEEDKAIDFYFGSSTRVRDFLLDAIEVFKQGKSNETNHSDK